MKYWKVQCHVMTSTGDAKSAESKQGGTQNHFGGGWKKLTSVIDKEDVVRLGEK